MTDRPSLPPIGVIGLPSLVRHCATLGLETLTDDDVFLAAAAVADRIRVAGPQPVIVAGSVAALIGPVLADLAAHTLVVVAGDPDGAVLPEGTVVVVLPAPVSQLLAATGIAGLDAAADTLVVRDGVDAEVALTTGPTGSGTSTTLYSSLREKTSPELEIITLENPRHAPDAAPVGEGRDAGTAQTQAPDTEQTRAVPEAGNCVVVWSGKGGVGKSTLALGLAEHAAKAGLRVALIDANYGQGDLRTYLRIGTAGLPSVFQAANGKVEAAFIDADTLNLSRSIKLEPVGFTVVQAPPPHLADDPDITPELYLAVVSHALAHFDLVVIDTQIVESVDRTGMVDRFVVPLLRAGARGLAVTDSSGASFSNLLTRLKVFAASGIPASRQLVAFNRIPRLFADDVAEFGAVLADHATVVGSAFSADSVCDATHRGRPIAHLDEVSGVLDNALRALTGQPLIDQAVPAETTEAVAEADQPPAAATEPAAPAATVASPKKASGGSFFVGLFRRRR